MPGPPSPETGPGTELNELRRFSWYYSTQANPGWCVWAVVVELAIRNAIKEIGGFHLTPQECEFPAVSFEREATKDRRLHSYLETLSIQAGGFEATGRRSDLKISPARTITWQLKTTRAPWHSLGRDVQKNNDGDFLESFGRMRWLAPSAQCIWDWARGKDLNKASHYLCEALVGAEAV